MLELDEISAMLLFCLRSVHAATLRDLLEGVEMVLPEIKPATVHDALNTLLAEGTIELTRAGMYLDPGSRRPGFANRIHL